MSSVYLFILIFILTAFFTKNMIIICFTSFILTNVVKYGIINEYTEGFEDNDDEEEEDEGFEDPPQEDDGAVEYPPQEEDGAVEDPPQEEDGVVEYPPQEETEGFEENPENELNEAKKPADSEEYIFPEEKILKQMNKYKPLLETLNEFSKNMAVFA
jgi:hypothetical protein